MSEVKSWVYTRAGYPETLQLQKTTIPARPAPHHVLVEIRASAVNPVDIQLMNLPLNSLPLLDGPKIAGRDFAGVVLAAAPETGLAAGDEVMGLTLALDGSGTLTAVAHLDARRCCIVPKPARLAWAQAAGLPLVGLTARTAVERCAPFMRPQHASHRLVVLGGSSATGLHALRLARARGWTALASCSARNAALVRAAGAAEVVDYTAGPAAVRAAVRAFRPDAVVDCVGGTDCLGLAPQYVSVVGDKTGRDALGGSVLYLWHPRMLLRWLLGCLGLGASYECIMLEMRRDWLADVAAAAAAAPDDVVIDSTYPFDKADEAYARLNTGRARGKVVVVSE